MDQISSQLKGSTYTILLTLTFENCILTHFIKMLESSIVLLYRNSFKSVAESFKHRPFVVGVFVLFVWFTGRLSLAWLLLVNTAKLNG